MNKESKYICAKCQQALDSTGKKVYGFYLDRWEREGLEKKGYKICEDCKKDMTEAVNDFIDRQQNELLEKNSKRIKELGKLGIDSLDKVDRVFELFGKSRKFKD